MPRLERITPKAELMSCPHFLSPTLSVTIVSYIGMHGTGDYMRAFLITIIITILTCQALPAGDWPQFRGPHGNGHSEEQNLPTTWGGLFGPPAWQTDIPGTGWSSPIVIGDRIWLTTAELTALPDKARVVKLEKNPYSQVEEFQVSANVSLLAVELDATNGKILRQLELFTCEDAPPIHINNTYASPTPVTDGNHLYCHFGSLGTFAVSLATGQVVWSERFAVQDITGPGSSPVLCGERLILVRDGADAQYVVALNKHTGTVDWRTERPKIETSNGLLRRSFCTPLVIDDGQRRQIIAPAAQWVMAYDPESGQELWRANFGSGHALVPRPVFWQGLIYICTGYWHPELWALRVDGAGDVTNTHVAWKYRKQVPLISSPIIVDNEIYFASSRGIVRCLDAGTGDFIWQQRLEGSFSASPLAGDGKLYFTSEQGITTVLRAGREYHELARNQLIGQTMASLAVTDGALLIRTASTLYCIRKTRP
jgi:outer membrane protein assembly factor BamB